jgi:hypothetical protein
MTKTDIDYSNTIIYKITCKDENVTDVYVGHTTNFVQRKHAHKQSCINNKSSNYNCKLYEVIRNKGGWNNWKMDIIHFFNCKDHFEARKKEQEYFISLNATLNSVEPMPKPVSKPVLDKEVVCEKCDIHYDTVQLLETHNNKSIDSNKKLPKIGSKFYCQKCDYGTCKKSSYDDHLLSKKHIKSMVSNEILPTKGLSTPKHECLCGKVYKDYSGLWRHKKKCKNDKDNDTNDNDTIQESNNQITPELVMSILHQNKELQKILIEQNKTIIELSKNNDNPV